MLKISFLKLAISLLMTIFLCISIIKCSYNPVQRVQEGLNPEIKEKRLAKRFKPLCRDVTIVYRSTCNDSYRADNCSELYALCLYWCSQALATGLECGF